ncbi:NUDIX hydrolase [Microlunatus panaciterrae]|uniref:ADP-ribose pyrophosphatase n=1 Tax=Microlunatus panaciterrae TaxID=400768 RepID=A0ABS2RN79_9ACTN|nr:NUDIX hydrolase [Microlunatus panaciterrae]MBM7800471.1 ADP-ribose pyrophosphatase [Microlunatus panaciterrae]
MIILSRADLVDAATAWQVQSTDVLAEGQVTTYIEDAVLTPDGERMRRQYLRHPGAVGVIALDEDDRVALVRQYRHPVRHRLIEPPAGLLDVDGEDYLVGARRELAEEVDLGATDWRVLVDIFTSPGMAAESLRIYLARGLHAADAPEDFSRNHEEAHMDTVWASLDDLVDAVLAGDLHNPVLVMGILAAAVARSRGGFDTLRPADAPWPAREDLLRSLP